jgi:hypothetical protein
VTEAKPPPASCVTPERTEAAYAARRQTLLGTVAKGRDFTWEVGTPLDVEAARAVCKDVSEDMTTLCFEGVAQNYGTALAKNPSEAAVRAAPAELAKIDAHSATIHCRGLGAGLHAGGITPDKLNALTAGVDTRCRNNMVEGYSARVYMTYLKIERPVPPPTAEQLAAAKLEDACAGLDARWCAYGSGRALTHLYPGDPMAAARGCHGALRGPCLAGIAYVTAYLYEPEDLGQAVQPMSTFTGDDRAAYAEGFGSALQWSRKANAAHLEHSIACVPEAQRAIVQDIGAKAQACNAFDIADGTNCRWADVTQK